MNVIPQIVIKKEIPVPQGYEGRTLKEHTIINLPDWLSDEYSKLMDLIDGMDYYVRIQTEGEIGGKHGSKGDAGIICDLNGDPLENSYLVKSGIHKDAETFVITSEPYIHVSAHLDKEYIIIHMKEIIPKLPFYHFETLWKYDGVIPGIEYKIPNKFNKYKNVIMAAVKKSQCENCHCLHFY